MRPTVSRQCLDQSLCESLQDDAPQTSDLVDIAPFLCAVPHNLRRFQPTVIEQVGQSPLMFTGEPGLDPAPNLQALGITLQVLLC